MRRRAPSLEAAEAFLAAARLGSFHTAAAELALSPSAVSRRIQALEEFLGQILFDRSAKMLRLTQAGRQYRDEIASALDTILNATARMRSLSGGSRIRLMTSHGFALGWLMPRLPGLSESLGLDIELAIGRGAHHLRSGEIDLAVWGGPHDAGGYASDPLMELEAIPVAAMQMTGGRKPPGNLAELLQHRLLCARNVPNLWPGWLSAIGYDGLQPPVFAEVDNTHFVYESAASGLGVALAVPLLADRIIHEDRLHPCFPVKAKVPVHYHLIYARDEIRGHTEVKRFRAWLAEEIRTSAREFDRWRVRCNGTVS